MKKILLASMNPELVATQIGDFIVNRISKTEKSGGILGLSGGVDSTTVAALAKRSFDKYNLGKNLNQKLELVGYLLPSKTNSQSDEDDGKKVAERLGIRNELISIEPFVEAYGKIDSLTLNSKFHKGNLMSEIRALVLHRKSALENKIILGTGNRDEDFGVGYYTLFGDGSVHISPIGNLPKRLVREMARYLGFSDLADRVPTAGLEPGQTDFKDLGYQYEFVELCSEARLQGFTDKEIIQHPQILEMAENNLCEYKNKFNFDKFNSREEMIYDFFRRNNLAKMKGRLICPEIAPITLEYRGQND